MNIENPCGLCCTKIENLNVKRGSITILEDINLHIHCGELTALIGPNGAGKTTLLQSILGQVKHNGRLSYLDVSGKKTTPRIGYVPQNLRFDPGTPLSVLDVFAASLSKRPIWSGYNQNIINRAEQALARLDSELLLYKKLGNLSGGELQRVLLAIALEPLPDLLLLDEPVSGIDQQGLQVFLTTVAKLPKIYDLSVILVSHDLNLVSIYADRIVLLNKKIEFVGTPAEFSHSSYYTELKPFQIVRPGNEGGIHNGNI